MATYSLLDTAFALDANTPEPWSLRKSLKVPMFPVPPAGPFSVRKLARRFSAAGKALRSLVVGDKNAWKHLDRSTIVWQVRDRLRDPMIIRQANAGLCGPVSIMMEFVRRAPARYVLAVTEVLEKGELTCPTGRVIVAEEELREEPPNANMDQVDWLLAATMRDDANLVQDVEGDAVDLEAMTLWEDQMQWVRDVIDLPAAYETCFTEGEIGCMKKAEAAVKAGGVAFFLVDANVIFDGKSDSEENMRWRRSDHLPGNFPAPLSAETHSVDDGVAPDHWVAYLGGLNLASDPGDDDSVSIRVWSWGAEFIITGTVDAFTEYLYGVVTGR